MKTFFLSLLTLAQLYINAQTDFVWAKRIGGTSVDFSNDIATDANGNTYTTGYFRGTVDFDPGTDTFNLTSLDDKFFICKFDAEGNLLWAKTSGGSDNGSSQNLGKGIATDSYGNVYVTGSFSGDSITFENNLLLFSSTAGDIFVVKYNSDGNVLWAKSAGGSSNCKAISTDINGNVFVTGQFNAITMNFGNDTLINSSPYNSDIFLAKYDSSGSVIWAKSAGGYGTATYKSEFSYGVSTDMNGNIFITGSFWTNTIIFGNDTLTNPNNSGPNSFIVKYNSFGNVIWAKSAGTGVNDYTRISDDINGNIYLTGVFVLSMGFGNDTLTNNGGDDDIFIAKYDSLGNVLWAKSAGSTDNDYVSSKSISTDETGNVYITGDFRSSTIDFGNDIITNSGGFDNGMLQPYSDLFIAKYDASGNFIWAKSAGANDGNDYCYGIATDINGNAYVTGNFRGTTIGLGSDTLTNFGSNSSDIFIAKLGNAVGTEEGFVNKDLQFKIYPNPSNGNFNLIISQFENLKMGKIKIYNVLGEMVYQSTINNPQSIIDLSKQPAGIYFIQAQTAEKTYTQKLIVE